MKKIFLFFIITLLSLTICSCKKEKDDNVITIGASSTPHAQILEQARTLLAAKGYTLEIIVMDDYVTPNISLYEGSIDANYFQHTPFLNDFNLNNGTNLVSAGLIHYEPFGLYGNGITSIAGSNKQILIPNDGSNRSRALFLLQQVGLITLKEGIDPADIITQKDIVDFKGCVITELKAANVSSALRSSSTGTLAVVNGNYALSSGLNVNDALAIEDASGLAATTYANIVAVRNGDINSPKIQALIEVLKSETIKNYIKNNYGGAVLPSN